MYDWNTCKTLLCWKKITAQTFFRSRNVSTTQQFCLSMIFSIQERNMSTKTQWAFALKLLKFFKINYFYCKDKIKRIKMHIKCFRVQDFIMKRKKLTILWLILHYFHNKNRNFATVKKKTWNRDKIKVSPNGLFHGIKNGSFRTSFRIYCTKLLMKLTTSLFLMLLI